MVRVLSVVGAVVASVTMLGSGVASAYDPLVGKTYSDASAYIAKYKGKPVIATVVGSQLAMDDCIVTSWHLSKFLNSSGRNARGNEWLLSLNCNNALAGPGRPGNSAMSPEGVQAKTQQQAAATINKDPTICDKSDVYKEWCAAICKSTGLCQV